MAILRTVPLLVVLMLASPGFAQAPANPAAPGQAEPAADAAWGDGTAEGAAPAGEPAPAPAEAVAPAEAAAELSTAEKIDAQFGVVVGFMASILFGQPVEGIPLIVLVLLFGSIFFTFYHRWLNIRGFRHAIDVTRGKYDNPDDPGEISHFQALTSALSATVGLGNIAGVAFAIHLGGPAAYFGCWLLLW